MGARRTTREDAGTAALPVRFYDRDPALVAREMLGTIVERVTEQGTVTGRIVETEAYLGPHDPACHASAGLTARTRVLYGPPGLAYVYLIYGVYWCLNAVTRESGFGSAVLVRAIEPLSGLELMRARRPGAHRDRDLTNGPGKLCLAFGIDGTLNGGALDRPPLRILRGEPIADADVRVSPRIGISRAAEWPYRYFIADNEFVSKTPKSFAVSVYSAAAG